MRFKYRNSRVLIIQMKASDCEESVREQRSCTIQWLHFRLNSQHWNCLQSTRTLNKSHSLKWKYIISVLHIWRLSFIRSLSKRRQYAMRQYASILPTETICIVPDEWVLCHLLINFIFFQYEFAACVIICSCLFWSLTKYRHIHAHTHRHT